MDPTPTPAAAASPDETEMLTTLTATLAEAGMYLAVERDGDALILSGEVDSAENREAALDVARAVAEPRGLRVDDGIDVLLDAPETVSDRNTGGSDAFGYLDPDRNDDTRLDPGFEGDPDFTDDIGTSDPMEAVAEATPYFPPTDPVVRPSADDPESLEVLGGFGATAMDAEEGGASFDARNDDDISEAVNEALAADALTTDLNVHAETRDGTVHLRGVVETLDDAEDAEAVAAEVGGVKEVIEELDVLSISGEGDGGRGTGDG